MLAIILLIPFLLFSVAKDKTHILGLWLFVMIIHGDLVERFGNSVIHLPFYSGLIVIVTFFVTRRYNKPNSLLVILSSIIVIGMLLSSILGINPSHSINSITLYIKGMLLALAVSMFIQSESQVETISKYYLLGIVYGVVLALFQYFTGQYLIDGHYIKRVGGLRGDPNDTAVLLLSGIGFCIYFFNKHKTLYLKLANGVLIALILYSVMLTQSRGAFVTASFLLLIVSLYKTSVKKIVFSALCVALIAVMAPSSYVERVGALLTGEELHGSRSMHNRKNLIIKGSELVIENPIVGVGPGNYGEAILGSYDSVFGNGHILRGKGSAAHNMYVEFFVENGVIIGLVLLGLLYRPLRRILIFEKCYSMHGISSWLGVNLLVFYISGMFLSQGKNSVMWFMIGVCFSCYLTAKTTTERSK